MRFFLIALFAFYPGLPLPLNPIIPDLSKNINRKKYKQNSRES